MSASLPREIAQGVADAAVQVARRLHVLKCSVLFYADGSRALRQAVEPEASAAFEAQAAASRRGLTAALEQAAGARAEALELLARASAQLERELSSDDELAPDPELPTQADLVDDVRRRVAARGPVGMLEASANMMDRLRADHISAADALRALAGQLGTVADPELLVLSRRFEQLAVGMTPPTQQP